MMHRYAYELRIERILECATRGVHGSPVARYRGQQTSVGETAAMDWLYLTKQKKLVYTGAVKPLQLLKFRRPTAAYKSSLRLSEFDGPPHGYRRMISSTLLQTEVVFLPKLGIAATTCGMREAAAGEWTRIKQITMARTMGRYHTSLLVITGKTQVSDVHHKITLSIPDTILEGGCPMMMLVILAIIMTVMILMIIIPVEAITMETMLTNHLMATIHVIGPFTLHVIVPVTAAMVTVLVAMVTASLTGPAGPRGRGGWRMKGNRIVDQDETAVALHRGVRQMGGQTDRGEIQL